MSVFGGEAEGTSPKLEDTTLQQQKDVTVATGIPGFDDTLGQGLPSGNLYLIYGSLGSASAQFAQQILYNTVISKGKVTYYSVESSSTDIIQNMQVFGLNIQSYVDDGSWAFGRVIPPNMKTIMDALPEAPMEKRIDLDETFTKLMNHFYDAVKEGRNTVITLPLLIRNYPLQEVQNLLFYMTGIARRHGGVHFILLTEGANDPNTIIALKDVVDTVFDITTATRGTEVENVVSVSKIRGIMPKSRTIRLGHREGLLATETIRRVH
jgi:KaiC/GvpD/RAD55 family RecA-like ATPase